MAKQEIRNVTFSPEQLQAVIAQAIAEHEVQKAQQAKPDMERATVAAFKRKGYTDIKPRVNTLTYAKWIEQGRKVREGEQSIKVRNLRLFHLDQTDPISKSEQAKLLKEKADRILVKTADKLPKPSPVEPVKPAPKSKGKAKPTAQPQLAV